MSDENGYNGWANWDTWNAYNWLSSDETVYRYIVPSLCDKTPGQQARQLRLDCSEWLAARDGIDPEAVNWRELAEAFTEE